MSQTRTCARTLGGGGRFLRAGGTTGPGHLGSTPGGGDTPLVSTEPKPRPPELHPQPYPCPVLLQGRGSLAGSAPRSASFWPHHPQCTWGPLPFQCIDKASPPLAAICKRQDFLCP